MINPERSGHGLGEVIAHGDATLPGPTETAASPRTPGAASDRRITELFSSHFEFVWRSVRRLGVPEDAVDDAAQEVFVVASRRLDGIEPGKEKSFLFGTAVRVASTARRTRGRRREQGDDGIEQSTDPGMRPDELLDRKRARQLLDDVIATLPEEARPVFVLYELEGMTMAEIAACLEIPPGTVASRLRRAREVFAQAVARIAPAARGATLGGHHG